MPKFEYFCSQVVKSVARDVNCIVDVRSEPAKTAMHFDSHAFREEHAALWQIIDWEVIRNRYV